MRFTPSDKTSHSIAPEKLRCVWMTAGLLAYQLCDRQFDCDHCPLDKAMRMSFSPKRNKDRSPRHGKREQSKKEYLFSKNHCWVRVIDNDIVRVGLEPQFASTLVSSKAIAFPAIGENIELNQFCAWIILEGGSIPIRSPLQGKVCMTNALITDRPYELAQNPMTTGWLFSLQADQASLEHLHMMTKEQSDQLYAEDFARFIATVNKAMNNNHAYVGMTLQDGGALLKNIAEMIGTKKYCELLRAAFVTV